MKRVMRLILPLLLIFSGSGICLAQSTNSGDIRGSVTDPSGALIPDVTVTVVNVDTGVSKEFVTNRDGIYDTSSIVAGNYKITFSKVGFDQLVRGPITLQVGVSTINGELKVGSTNEQVVVTTDIPLLQTETGDQTTTLESKSMSQLPQVTQTWENFMILLPGTTGCSGNNCNEGSNNPGQGVSSNGNLPYSNILADGASTTLSHSQNANPAIFETVDELQVSLSSFSAQYGVGGMIINQISKGGTSRFHGSAYDYWQNDKLNAWSYEFGTPGSQLGRIPYLRYNNFGTSVGGPILKKKMFFFFDYDQIINHGSGGGGSFQTLPTTDDMAGNFAGQWQIFDPTTQLMATDDHGNPYPIRQPFANNQIPSTLFDSVSAKLQQFYPTPSKHIANGSFVAGSMSDNGILQNNWFSAVPQSTPYRKFFGRMDYDITSSNRLTMSDTQSDTPVIYPSNVTACPVQCQSGDVDNNNAQITDVWNITPNVINEARLGYTAQLNFFADLALGKGYAAQLGWQFGKADDFPALQYVRNYPYAWIDPSSNAVYKEHVFDPSDVVTMIHGRHILHFGGELLMYRDDSTAWGNTNAGVTQFSGQYTEQWALTLDSNGVTHTAAPVQGTGLEYADFLLGYVNHWDASVTPEYGARFKTPQIFIQDDFKIRPNLTINLGLRYQINHGWNETHGNIDSFDPTVTNPATNTLGAQWYASTHANGRTSLQENVFNVVLPRLGFSWSPKSNTTARGGFGLYAYNWSLDNYGSGMGHPFGSSGSLSDQTNGISPVVRLGGSGSSLPYTTASTDPARFNGSNVNYAAYHTPVAKIYQWNLAIQREFGANFVAELAYVASHGFNLPFSTDLNQIPESKLSANDSAFHPYPQYGNIAGNTLNAISNYNSLQASITRRLTSGVSFSFNYVWSHFLDDQDSSGWGSHQGPQPYQIANNPAANYSNSNFDVTQNFKGQMVYQLPFGKGMMFLHNNTLLDAVIGGWQLSGTIHLSTGNPFTVNGTQNTFAQAGSAFPNRVIGVSTTPQNKSIREWFNPAAFSLPADGTFGNVRRNSLYGPGIEVINLSGGKTFSMPWEGIKLQIRCDAANAFNHASFGQPNGNLSAPSGQQVGQAYTFSSDQINSTSVGGRNVQLGARLSF